MCARHFWQTLCGTEVPRFFAHRSTPKRPALTQKFLPSRRPPSVGLNSPPLQSVRQHLHRLQLVRLVHQRQLLQLPHPLRRFRAHQVPLPGVHPDNFPGAGNLKSLRGSPVRLQFLLRFRSIAWHDSKLS